MAESTFTFLVVDLPDGTTYVELVAVDTVTVEELNSPGRTDGL